MKNPIEFDAEDEDQLVQICIEKWKLEKNQGLRSIQKLTKKILTSTKNYFEQKHITVKNISEEEKSFAYNSIKELDDKIIKRIFKFFVNKEIKKYEGGIPQILKEKGKDVGIAVVLSGEKGFYDKWILAKEVKEENIVVIDVKEELPKKKEGEIQDPKFEELTIELKNNKKKTCLFIQALYKGITLDKSNREFFENFIKKYCNKKAKIYKETNPKKSEFYEENFNDNEYEGDKYLGYFIENLYNNYGYFEWKYEDFIITFVTLVKFFTGLKLTLEIEPNDKVIINFFCTERKLRGHAQAFEYDLQLKNYAIKYHKFELGLIKQKTDNTKIESNELNELFDVESAKLIDKIGETLQFHQMDQDVQFYFPPYSNYEAEKDNKFMRYTRNDNYHNCPNDPELSRMELVPILETLNTKPICCTNLRNIDKLRLIFRALDERLMFKKLIDYNYIEYLIILRNYNSYKDELESNNLVLDKINIFNSSKQLQFIQTVRNFYGERISFYFLFLNHYIMWLLFPTLIGFTVFIMVFFRTGLSVVNHFTNLSPMNLVFTIYASIIILWATLFYKVWRQKEKLYSFFWGTENFELEEAFDDTFRNDGQITFLFNFTISFQYKYKKILKYIISFLIVVMFCFLVIYLLIILFKWKADTIKYNLSKGIKPEDMSSKLPMMIGVLNGIQIKILSFIYSYIAVWLTKWENHEKASYSDYSLSLKLIIFEFINNYSSLYYIAFLKDSFEGCKDGNCLAELNIQIYMIMITNFFFNLIEIGKPFIMVNLNKKDYIKNYADGNEIEFTPHGIHQQRVCEEFSTLRDDYNEILIQFGYLMFFSVAAPITPLICFCLAYIEKYVDAYKMFYLHRVTIIDQANGIGLYNKLLRVWCFIGMTTNIALVLFTNPDMKGVNIYTRFFIFFIIENSVLVLTYALNWNTLPNWFENKQFISTLYTKNYLNKDYDGLPHHDLFEKYNINKNEVINISRTETL